MSFTSALAAAGTEGAAFDAAQTVSAAAFRAAALRSPGAGPKGGQGYALSGIGDVWVEVENRDFGTAKRLGQAFTEDVPLLEQLGWAETIDQQRR